MLDYCQDFDQLSQASQVRRQRQGIAGNSTDIGSAEALPRPTNLSKHPIEDAKR